MTVLLNLTQKKFDFRSTWAWIFLGLLFLLPFFWAAYFPFFNDEAYYWDWSRQVQLSYVDAPPAVAWVSYLGTKAFGLQKIGARFFLPLIHFLSCVFLFFSTKLILNHRHSEKNFLTWSHVLVLMTLSSFLPIFALESFLLLPDATLLLACAGSLFFALNMAVQAKKISIQNAAGLGLFFGMGALSKYQMAPIACGLVIAVVSFRGLKKIKEDGLSWFIAFVISVAVASPMLIWNMQNHFASFQFQSQHGFSGFHFNLIDFSRYLFGVFFYLFPWYGFLFFKMIFKNKWKSSLFSIGLLPFFFLFFIISFSALGKQALPHWVMPGFFLLIPFLAVSWDDLVVARPLLWARIQIFSCAFSLLLLSLLCFDFFERFLLKSAVSFFGDATALSQLYLWKDLEKELLKQQHIAFSTGQPQEKIASLNWYWTAQMAFSFSGHPWVYNFDLEKSSYYRWRDAFASIANCPVVVLGDENHFDRARLEGIMRITSVQQFSLKPYDKLHLVLIHGVMKDTATLGVYDQKTTEKIQY